MAYKSIYLEPSEEITSVIDKIESSDGNEIAIVPTKNSTLFQSLVNLKLLSKEAKRLNKKVALITSDKVGQRLAGQVGITTFATIAASSSASSAVAATPKPPVADLPADEVINGVKVKQYNPDGTNPSSEVGPEVSATPIKDDLPKTEEVKEAPATSVTPEVSAAPVKPESPTPSSPSQPDSKPKEPEDLPAIMSRSGGYSQSREFKIPWKSVIVGAAVLLFMFILTALFVPRAVVTVTFPATPINEQALLSASIEEFDEGEIPDKTVAGERIVVKKSKSESVSATGKKDIGTKSTGTVTITNRYTDSGGAGRDQTFPAGTKVTDNNTKLVYLLNSTVTVGKVTYNPNNGQPIYKSQSVAVTAEDFGENYNIAPSNFTLAGALSDTPTTSSAAFSGGLKREVTVLSQSDVDEAIIKIRSELKKDAIKEIEEKSDNRLIISEALWEDVAKEGADKSVGQETESARVEVEIEYGVIVFNEQDAVELFTATFDGRLTEDEELIFPEDSPPQFRLEQISDERDAMSFEVSGTAYKVPKIDKKRIASSINNMSTTAAAEFLTDQYKARQVDIAIKPSWWIDRLPVMSWAISIEHGFDDQQSVETEDEDEAEDESDQPESEEVDEQ